MSQHSDDYLLSLTNYGPAVIGDDLYAEVQACVQRTQANAHGQNVLGPAILATPTVAPLAVSETPATKDELAALPYATLRGLAVQHGVEVAGNPKKGELVDALVVAGVTITAADAE